MLRATHDEPQRFEACVGMCTGLSIGNFSSCELEAWMFAARYRTLEQGPVFETSLQGSVDVNPAERKSAMLFSTSRGAAQPTAGRAGRIPDLFGRVADRCTAPIKSSLD